MFLWGSTRTPIEAAARIALGLSPVPGREREHPLHHRHLPSFVVLLLLAPLAGLLGGLVLFGLVGHVLSPGAMVSRTAFDCPFSERRASVEFLSEPGSDRPTGVLSCSVFAPKPYHVRCEKGCLGLAETGWALSPMMPRYALLSGGLAYRATPPPERPDTAETVKAGLARVA